MSGVCKLYKKVAFAHTGRKEAVFTRLRCKQWSCEYCARKNASIWREFLKEKLPNVSDSWWLLTLTAHSNTSTAQSSLHNIRKNIDRIFKRVRRVFQGVNYVRVFERHPTSERIHVHFIVSGLCPFVSRERSSNGAEKFRGIPVRSGRKGVWGVKTWFKKTCQECEIGYICDVRCIAGEVGKAVHYVCKYMTKAQQDLHEKGLRHVQTTRNIGSPKGDKDKEWQTAAYITPRMFEPNTSIVDLNTGQIIDNDYWEVHNFYPYDD